MATDLRIVKQAWILVNHSVKVKKGDKVLIVSDFDAKPLALEVYKEVLRKGASEVFVRFDQGDEFKEVYFKYSSASQRQVFPAIYSSLMKKVDCWIGIFSPQNTRALSKINALKISQRAKVIKPISDWRVEKTRWVISIFPNQALAQEADMSLSDYQDFVFNSISSVNWKKVYGRQEKLRKLLNKTKLVRILDKDTDLRFSIMGRKAENCSGQFNMPDGEVFTSVVENSTQGYITFSYPAIYLGREFQDVYLEFKKGKVTLAKALKNEGDLVKIVNTDRGSRTLGEFGIGNNYKIKCFSKEILFDEKIGGTIHLALGSGYKETLSKNKSAIHWDMIKDLRVGGELYFDGKLVQKRGVWKI